MFCLLKNLEKNPDFCSAGLAGSFCWGDFPWLDGCVSGSLTSVIGVFVMGEGVVKVGVGVVTA